MEAGSRGEQQISTQAKSQRAEALVEAFILSKKLQPWYTLLLLLVPGMHYVQH